MNKQNVRFDNTLDTDFFKTLKTRIDNYFKSRDLSKYSNTKMVLKTITMISLYIFPYLFLVTDMIPLHWGMFLLVWFIMGLGYAGIGLSIMHDANHNAYSKKSGLNIFLGNLLDFIGGSSTNWKLQHNVLHHTYTNIDGLDEDLDSGPLLRFSPHQERYKIHRFQHIYGWFLYCLMTLNWITYKDYAQLYRYHKIGLLKASKMSYSKEFTKMLIFKLFYYAYMLVLPYVLIESQAWYVIFAGYLIMNFTASLFLSCVFQSAHVMETSEYNEPDEKNMIHDHWSVHQLYNTSNFAPDNKLLSWYIGGLNFQIEHHLFPRICHIHYPEISKIVEKTAKEYNMPYNVRSTFIGAIIEHGRVLRAFGKFDNPLPPPHDNKKKKESQKKEKELVTP